MKQLIDRYTSKFWEGEKTEREKNEFAFPLKEMKDPFNLNIQMQDSQIFGQKLNMSQGKLQQSNSYGRGSGRTSWKNWSKTDLKTELNPLQQSIKKYRQIISENYKQQFPRKFQKNQSTEASNSLPVPKPRFKAYRLKFVIKEDKDLPQNLQRITQQNYLFHQNFKSNERKIMIYELKPQRIISHTLHIKELNISKSIAYDPQSSRLFYFGNDKSQLIVASLRAKQIICRLQVKYKRIDPILWLEKYMDKNFLLVIGGYKKTGNIAEGMKYIEIFLIDKWEISMSKKCIKLNIGRISPIVFQSVINEEACICIIGGNSVAHTECPGLFSSKNEKEKLRYDKNQDINFSANQTGIKISSSQIYKYFYEQSDNFLIKNDMNVRFINPLELHSGCVLMRKLNGRGRLELFLPDRKQIFNLKIINNEISIIESKIIMNEKQVFETPLRFTFAQTKTNGLELKTITKDGKLKTVDISTTDPQSKNQSCYCQIM